MLTTALHKRTGFFILLSMIMILAACNANQPAATPADDVRLRDGNMPKQIVTIAFTPTLDPTNRAIEAASSTPAPTETATLPPRPTASPTRYVGVFLGEPTSVGPEGEIEIPPTIAPLNLPDDSSSNPVGSIPQQPVVVVPQSAANCQIPVAPAFANAYSGNTNLQAFGCPRDAGTDAALVTQRFDGGRMVWRDTRQIIVLGDNGTYWRVTDTWNEGIPVDDPALAPPEGKSQPIRGFGLVWRSNDAIRNQLGWALGPEFPIASYWQEFEGGTLFLGDGSQVYGITAAETGRHTGGIPQ